MMLRSVRRVMAQISTFKCGSGLSAGETEMHAKTQRLEDPHTTIVIPHWRR